MWKGTARENAAGIHRICGGRGAFTLISGSSFRDQNICKAVNIYSQLDSILFFSRDDCFVSISSILNTTEPFKRDIETNSLDDSISLCRWCIVNIYQVRFIRELLEVINVGPTPPPILYLSDGGHVENLGILPLLKKSLQKIVVVDGGDLEDLGIAGDLITALKKAREKLHCSFTGMNGRDVYEDLRTKVIDRPARKQPRS